MKDKIINQIIHELIPLRTLYSEIDTITNDLLNNNLDSLKVFLDNNYQDTNINPDLNNLVISLVNDGKLPNTYLNFINYSIESPKLSKIDLVNFLNSKLLGYKAINIKHDNLNNIKINIENGFNIYNVTDLSNSESNIINEEHLKLTPISDYEFPNEVEDTILSNQKLTPVLDDEFKNDNKETKEDIKSEILEHPKLTPVLEDEFFEDIKETKKDMKSNALDHPKLNPEDIEIESLEETYIEKLRKSIMEAQLNYLNNANSFIEELEYKSESEIYQKLLSLNDIRYIHHSISKLSNNTLNRLLPYITDLINKDNHNSINIFIEESIKKNLHGKEKKM